MPAAPPTPPVLSDSDAECIDLNTDSSSGDDVDDSSSGDGVEDDDSSGDDSVDSDSEANFPYTGVVNTCYVCGRSNVRLWRPIQTDYDPEMVVCAHHVTPCVSNASEFGICWLNANAQGVDVDTSYDQCFVPFIPFCVHDVVSEDFKTYWRVWGFRDIVTLRPESEIMREWWLSLPL
jgi:hypothetical protein